MKSIIIAIALVIALPANAEISAFATQDSYSRQMEDMRREIKEMKRRERKRQREQDRQRSPRSFESYMNRFRNSNSKY